MASEFTFVAGNERLEFRVVGLERSSLGTENLEDWLDSTVSVNIGAFTGSFKAAFTISDLIILDEQLRNALSLHSGTASLKNSGGDISLSVEFKERQAVVSGVIQPHRLKQAALHVRLDMSEAALYQTVQELEDVFRKFRPHMLKSRGAIA